MRMGKNFPFPHGPGLPGPIQVALLMIKMMAGTTAVADAGASEVGGATSASAAAAASDHSWSSERPKVPLS